MRGKYHNIGSTTEITIAGWQVRGRRASMILLPGLESWSDQQRGTGSGGFKWQSSQEVSSWYSSSELPTVFLLQSSQLL